MKLTKILTMVSALFLLTNCGESDKKKSATPPAGDTIVVATSADFPPFSYKKDNELAGFEVDLINEVGKRIDKKIQIEDLNLDSLMSAVEAGRVHIGMAALSKTPDRLEKFDFSNPYYNSPSVIMLSVDNTATSLDDLNNKTVLVQQSSAQEFLIEQLIEQFKAANIVKMKSLDELVRQFEKDFDQTTVMILDQSVASNLLENNPHLKIKLITVEESGYDYGMIFQKGSELKAQIDEALQKIEEDGTMDQLKAKHGLA